MNSRMPVIGYAHLRANRCADAWEFTFLSGVQRQEHQELVGMSPDYTENQIRFSVVEFGFNKHNHPAVLFKPGPAFKIEDDVQYTALIQWIPGDTTRAPKICALVPRARFNLAENELQAFKTQQEKQYRLGEESLPSFHQAQAAEVVEKKKVAKRRLTPASLIPPLTKPQIPVTTTEPVPLIDSTGIYRVLVLGNRYAGTLRQIMDHFTFQWNEDPSPVLTSPSATWEKKVGMKSEQQDKAPALPAVDKRLIVHRQQVVKNEERPHTPRPAPRFIPKPIIRRHVDQHTELLRAQKELGGAFETV